MKVNVANKSEDHVRTISRAFSNMLDDLDSKLMIQAKDGNVNISRYLLQFYSPLVNSILNDVPSCIWSGIILPDVCKDSVDQLTNVLGQGFTKMPIDQGEHVMEIAEMLQINLTEISTVMEPWVKLESNEYFESGEEYKRISEIKEEAVDIKLELSDVKDETRLEFDYLPNKFETISNNVYDALCDSKFEFVEDVAKKKSRCDDRIKVQMESSFEFSEKVRTNIQDKGESQQKTATDPSETLIDEPKSSEVVKDALSDSIARYPLNKSSVLSFKPEKFFQKSLKQQVEELAKDQGMETNFKFVKPAGYDYKIGKRADIGDYEVCLSLSREEQSEEFSGVGCTPYKAIRTACRKARHVFQ